MNSFERFNEETLPARKYFSSSTKKGKIDNVGKYQMDMYVLKIIWLVKKFGVSLV